MRFTNSQAELDDAFNLTEQAALESAAQNGWLTLTPEVGDRALAEWQQECERAGKAFAVVRIEPTRASLWFIMTTDREWTQDEQARILGALAGTTGYVVTANQVRAFARLGAQDAVMRQLIAADTRLH